MDGDGALFDTGTAQALARAGNAERSLLEQLELARAEGRLSPVDEPLAEAALIAARALDTGDRIGGLKGGYLIAQSLGGYQKVLHALRMPTEIAPGPVPLPTGGQTEAPSWVSDAFGSPE